MISTEASHEGTAAVRGSLHMGIPRILVIGDYESIRETTSCILRGYGYLMDSVETGKQAIKKMRIELLQCSFDRYSSA